MHPSSPPTVPGPLLSSMTYDEQHLKLLSVFYYVFAGLSLLGICFGLLYAGFGLAMVYAPDRFSGGGSSEELPPVVGWLTAAFGGFMLVLSCTSAVLLLLTGRYLVRQKHRTFCLVIAGLSCLSVPLGTLLGVFTFIVLLRPSVIELFRQNASGHAVRM